MATGREKRAPRAVAEALRVVGPGSRGVGEEQEVAPLELFYDLVFVFAITQVSHLLSAT